MGIPSNWTYGITFNIIGSILINGGQNFIKLGHDIRNESNQNVSPSSPANGSSPVSSISKKNERKRSSAVKNDVEQENLISSKKKNQGFHECDEEDLSEMKSVNSHVLVKSSLLTHKNGRGRMSYIAGVVSYTIGSIANFASFGFAPQSLLAAFGSTQFVSNVFFAKFVLGERVTRRTLLATLAIVCGNLVVVYSYSIPGSGGHKSTGAGDVGGLDSNTLSKNDDKNKGYSVEDEEDAALDENLSTNILNNFDMSFMIFLTILFICGYAIRRIYFSIERRVKAGEIVKMSGLFLPISFATYSAIFGAQSVLLAKCVSMLIRARANGNVDEESSFTLQILLMVWIIPTGFWLLQLNRALAIFDGLIIIPLMQVAWTFISIISGGVFFKEFKSFSWYEIQLFSSGILIVFIGVYLLFPVQHLRLDYNALPYLRNVPSIIELTALNEVEEVESTHGLTKSAN